MSDAIRHRPMETANTRIAIGADDLRGDLLHEAVDASLLAADKPEPSVADTPHRTTLAASGWQHSLLASDRRFETSFRM